MRRRSLEIVVTSRLSRLMIKVTKRLLKRAKGKHSRLMLEGAVRNGVFAQSLDLLVGQSLIREAKAVAAGRLRYHDDLQSTQSSYAMLRRNTHRLEKGLIMRPRRDEFGIEYIGETVAAYCRLLAHLSASDETNEELLWAYDVLSEYFATVRSSATEISHAQEEFEATSGPASIGARPGRSVPFCRAAANPSDIDIRSFMALAKHRRSVRWYRQERVPRDVIDEALDVARQAPSACNRQSLIFHVFDTPESVQRVVDIPLGTKGFGHNVPAFAVIVGRLRAYPHPRDRHAIYVDGALAAMSFVLALETAGLASCLINWADQEPQESLMANVLGLEPDERVIVSVAFGYPDYDGMVPYSAKREIDTLRIFH